MKKILEFERLNRLNNIYDIFIDNFHQKNNSL